MTSQFKLSFIAAAAAALALTACGNEDKRSAGQQVDSAIAKVEQKADDAKTSTEAAAGKAANAVENTTNQVVKSVENTAGKVADKVESTAGKVASKVEDAAITASVNAELAKDPTLSALRINVDTDNGHVMLRGTAPDKLARDRATRLAAAVKGVSKVDNQLIVPS